MTVVCKLDWKENEYSTAQNYFSPLSVNAQVLLHYAKKQKRKQHFSKKGDVNKRVPH